MNTATAQRPRALAMEELQIALEGRQQHPPRPWQAIADALGRPVQAVKDQVWEVEALGLQMVLDGAVERCGRERVRAYLLEVTALLVDPYGARHA